MDSIVDVVDALAGRDDPVLTWYGSADERIDLAGKTAANWVIKATNLLMMELDCRPGSSIWLDLPPHWRSVIWAHAAWCAGCSLTFTGDGADVAITAAPSTAHDHLETVVIALPALARRVEDLPPDAIDGAADLMTQADVFIAPPAGGDDHPTGLGPTQAGLLAAPVGLRPAPGIAAAADPERILLLGSDLTDLLTAVPALWAAGAGVVIAPDAAVARAEEVTHIHSNRAP